MKMLKDKIRELRQKEGLTQEALANRIHVSRSLIAKWESGKGMPTESDLALLSELFDVSSQELVSDRECERTIVKKNRKIRGLYAAIVFLTAVLSVTTTLAICAYSGIIGLRGEQTSSEIKHIHQYEIAETIAPTCIDDGIVRYECACKEMNTRKYSRLMDMITAIGYTSNRRKRKSEKRKEAALNARIGKVMRYISRFPIRQTFNTQFRQGRKVYLLSNTIRTETEFVSGNTIMSMILWFRISIPDTANFSNPVPILSTSKVKIKPFLSIGNLQLRVPSILSKPRW